MASIKAEIKAQVTVDLKAQMEACLEEIESMMQKGSRKGKDPIEVDEEEAEILRNDSNT